MPPIVDALSLRREAYKAVEQVWFIQTLEEVERTDITLSLRLNIRPGLFVQVFHGARSGSLFFALIESGQRIFGIDLEDGRWHLHPFAFPERHEPLNTDLGPKPLLAFLARVEALLIEEDLL